LACHQGTFYLTIFLILKVTLPSIDKDLGFNFTGVGYSSELKHRDPPGKHQTMDETVHITNTMAHLEISCTRSVEKIYKLHEVKLSPLCLPNCNRCSR